MNSSGFSRVFCVFLVQLFLTAQLAPVLALQPIKEPVGSSHQGDNAAEDTSAVTIAGPNEKLDQSIDDPINNGVTPSTADLNAGKSADDKSTTNVGVGTVDGAAKQYSPTDISFVQRYLKATDYIPVSEIKPGMEGYGLTVFHGTKIERFGVKVIGIIRKALNGRDAILIRLSGEKLGQNNVVRGMSGSPIYLDGRLCGALSYGFDFSKEPIVGVTPVVDMLDALTFHDEVLHRRDISLFKKSPYIEAPASSLALPNILPVAGGTMRMTPLLAPVSLSGFSPRAQSFLKDKFDDVGLAIASGGTGALDPALVAKMGSASGEPGEALNRDQVAPGSAVAVMLTTGAFSSAATGTATAVFGKKVVAFGHSFMEGGLVSLPMATAYILEILPSLSVSFKLSSPLQIVGSIFADRPWSVGAELGRYATMVPVDISVLDQGRGVKKVFHCKVVNHPQLTPDLITASVMSSMDSTYQSQTPYVVKLESRINVKNHGVIKRVDRFPVNFSAHVTSRDSLMRSRPPGDPISSYIGGIVDRLISNDFERAQVSGVAVDVTIEDGRKLTKIDNISLDKSVVAPGESVTVNCLMKPYNGKPYNKQMVFRIPRDVPDCDLAIAACGGDELEAVRRRMGIAEPPSETLDQAIVKIERKERADTLCGVLALPQQSIAWQGQVLRSPPAHWTKLLFTDRATRTPSLVRSDESYHEMADNIIDGSHIIAVTVKRPDKITSKAMPMPISGVANRPADGMLITEQAKKALESGHKSDSASGSSAGSNASGATSPLSSASNSSSSSSFSGASSASSADTTKMPPLWSVASAFPHMRGIQLWRQDSEEDFRGAKLDGLQIDSWGRLTPGFKELARVYPALEEDQRIWAGVYLKGYFYYSCGNKIFRWDGSKKAPQMVAGGAGLIVPALAADPERGLLYFAAAPGNRVSVLNVDALDDLSSSKNAKSAPVTVAELSESTIDALAVSSAGTIYIGAGGSGKLYQRRIGQSVEAIADSGQAHISALWYSRHENRLYVGTAEKGSIYSLNCAEANPGQSSLRADYDSGEHIVTGVAKDKAGNLYVATAGSGKLLRIEPGGQAEAIALSEAFYSLYYDEQGDHVYAGDGEGDVTRIEIEKPPFSNLAHFLPVCHSEQEAVLAIAANGPGKLFVGTANVAQLRSLEIAPAAEASICSLVHDAQRPAEWSRLRVADLFNQERLDFNHFIKVETRGGETSQPDLSWSPWVVAPPERDDKNDGFVIKTSACRYLQYRLTWQMAELEKRRDILISRVDVTFLPTNSTPAFSAVSVKSGEALAGKVALAVTGSDADADNLALGLDLSSDGGKTWQLLASDLRSRVSDKEKAKIKADKEKLDKEKAEKEKLEKEKLEKKGAKGKSHKPEKTPEAKSETKPDPKSDLKPETKPENKLDPKPDSKSDQGGAKKSNQDVGPVSRLQDAYNDGPGLPLPSKNDDDDKDKDNASGKTKDKDKDKDKDKSKSGDKTSDASTNSSGKSSESFSQTEKFVYNLDSKKQKDGAYILRLTLSDKPSNNSGAENTVAFRSITIDNSEPLIDSLVLKKVEVGKLSVRLTAHDATSDISDCVCKIDDGEGFALAAPAGGGPLSDSSRAVFVGESVPYDAQAKKLTVQIFDRAGNSAKKTVSLP